MTLFLGLRSDFLKYLEYYFGIILFELYIS